MIQTKIFRFVDGAMVEVELVEKGYSHTVVICLNGMPIHTHILPLT